MHRILYIDDTENNRILVTRRLERKGFQILLAVNGREAVNKAQELSLAEGIDFERRLFYLLFSTEDQEEGMRAFIEKRKPEWKGR